MPGSRYYATTFTDKKGNLWLFGGLGDDSQGMPGWLNDFWEYNPTTGEWTWMAGDSTLGNSHQAQPGVYGTLGQASSTNAPGGRYGATGWTDATGNLWLFGGFGFDSAGAYAWLNDLWKFDISTGQWTWISGSSSDGPFGGWTPGVQGQWMTSAAANTPSGRFGAVSWTDSRGRLWLFGGCGIYGNPTVEPELSPYTWNLNDLWMFDPSTNEWTWIDGVTSLPVDPNDGFVYTPPGIYGTQGTPSITNLPGMRSGAIGLTDSSGRFWMFGGSGIDSGNGVASYIYAALLNDLWVYQPSATTQSAAAAPTFSPDSGTLSAGQAVAISDSTPGATIYYMVDQNAPPIEYTQPITVGSSETIVAIAVASGFANSSPTSATYAVPATATPIFSLASGEYTSGQTVSVSDSTPNALICYTLDGTTPTANSTLYQAPIAVTSSETIQAIAVAAGHSESAVASAVYNIWPVASVNEWAWMSGPNAPARPIWGSLGIASISNSPGGRSLPAYWTDEAGNFWMFGGYGYDAHDNNAYLNDLWEFMPSTNEWTWIGGDSAAPYGNSSGQPGVYGAQGTPASGNIPGGRQGAATWTDGKGNFWLYGGNGYDSADTYSDLNDLWMYKESSNQWTWINGSRTTSNGFGFNGYYFYAGVAPVYGTLGQPALTNTPGARDAASAWVDSDGNLWLFGGHGVDSKLLAHYAFSDLWKFSPSTNEWTWMGGSDTDQGASCVSETNGAFGTYCGHAGNYGTLGNGSAANNPGGRSGASSWIDGNGNLWLFGGLAFDANGNLNPLNDLWRFTPSTSQWTWMGGNNIAQSGFPAVYGTEGVPSAGNIALYAAYAATWTDKSGNFWLYGGSYSSSPYSPYLAFGTSGWDDLWEFNPSAGEWAWMNGTKVSASGGFFAHATLGIQGVPNSRNSPGGVFGVPAWTDGNGNLWMFDGLVWKFKLAAPAIVPSFALSLSSASISVTAGGDAASVVTTLVAGGFNSTVALSASGQPSGVTVQFSPTSISGAGTSQVTFSVGASVAGGSYTITITGTSGAIAETATISLTVSAPSPTFQLTSSANSLTVQSGSSGTVTLTVTPQNGFNAAVSFACSGLPSRANCSFAPTTVTPSGSAVTDTLTINASSSALLSAPNRKFFPLSTLALAALLFALRKRRGAASLLALVSLATCFSFMDACGGGGAGGGGKTSTTSTVTITANSGAIAQTAIVTLTVN